MVSAAGWYVYRSFRRKSGLEATGDLHEERIDRHKDGSIKAKGHIKEDAFEGHWEWFRKDGSKMRSGYFADGKQVGEWTTCDATGKVVKVTKFSR